MFVFRRFATCRVERLKGIVAMKTNLKHKIQFFLGALKPVILNGVKELRSYECKFSLVLTKFPHLLKGRFRDDRFFGALRPVVLNEVKELRSCECKFLLVLTKFPHLLNGRFRDDRFLGALQLVVLNG